MNTDQIDLCKYGAALSLARDLEAVRLEGKKLQHPARSLNQSSHLLGILGELLVGDFLDLDIDRNGYGALGDGGIDFMYRGHILDVKLSTFYKDPHLKHPVASKSWPDIFVLATIDSNSFYAKLVGWATASDLRGGRREKYGYASKYPENFVLYPSDLNPMASLLELPWKES